MKAFGRALAVAGVAVVLAVGFPLNAQAAGGTFIYHTQPGNVPHVLNNPQDEQCYNVGAGEAPGPSGPP
ncbi:hypothetical protein [Streptomyces buecherae]|uniref:Uncharacterized protein n=1 Tax=Streptomyces buecherae TaxID=2763006 RepID=A0A7H8NGT0_9ACTN|nr:hypothetical protein [Streptomyces buecherae]QKW53596.1 hypothetical protein HUT08_33150 [Streptomyces buecherae]